MTYGFFRAACASPEVIVADCNANADAIIAMAKEAVASKITGNVIKEIYVPGKLVNIVMK